MSIPSVQLIGKNSANRDVTLRVTVDEVPEDVAGWVALARAAGHDVADDLDQVIIGQHNGFLGLIAAFGTLDDVLVAKRIMTSIPDDADMRRAFAEMMRTKRVTLEDVSSGQLTFKAFDTYREFVESMASIHISTLDRSLDTVASDSLLSHIDWTGLALSLVRNGQILTQVDGKVYFISSL